MKILAMDTASGVGSVALLDGETLIAESLLNVRATHSERLLAQVREVLDVAGLSLSDLDLLAVTRGPGAFTGLRIGLSTAKGLAQAAGLSLVGISTLHLLAMNLPLSSRPICVMLDARKREVYTGMFLWQGGRPVLQGQEEVLPPRTLLERLPQDVALVGDATLIYRELIHEILGDGVSLLSSCHNLPRASACAELAQMLYDPQQAYPAADVSPCYIRPSDAELPRKKKFKMGVQSWLNPLDKFQEKDENT